MRISDWSSDVCSSDLYGAGIASSAGETPYAVESDRPERRPFDALTVFRTPYRIDIFQTVYYVIDSARQLYDLVSSDLVPVMDEARGLGSLPQTFPPKEAAGAACRRVRILREISPPSGR